VQGWYHLKEPGGVKAAPEIMGLLSFVNFLVCVSVSVFASMCVSLCVSLCVRVLA